MAFAKQIIGIVLVSLAIVSCQKPEKKASDANIYQEGINKLNSLSIEIRNGGLDLDSYQLQTDIHRTQPPFLEWPGYAEREKLAPKLESFISTAEKLLEIGNSRTVVFPEKERILREMDVAAYFLGECYSLREWDLNSEYRLSPKVDWYEFTHLFRRFAKGLNRLAALGFPNGTEQSLKIPTINPSKRDKFLEAETIYTRMMYDQLRIKVLLVRNSSFNNKGFVVFAEQAENLAAFAYMMRDQVRKKLQELK